MSHKLKMLVLFILLGSYAFAQQMNVTGHVTDDQGLPLPGVSIVIEGTATGTITDFDGKYFLNVETGKNLVFSFIGFSDQIITVNNSSINVKMKTDTEIVDEVVVVGYGTQDKKTLVGAVTTAKAEELMKKGPVSNMTNALQGEIPGVTVLISTGIPGGGEGSDYQASEILIRGKSTWNDASPLILVDGVERDMNDVDMSEVETFSVLKDASATAIYGVKGGNGVILITTKRGSLGKAKVSVSADIAFKSLSKVEKTAGSFDALSARNIALAREIPVNGTGEFYTLYRPKEMLDLYRSQEYPEMYTDIDWQDFMTKVGKTQKYNVDVSGGTENVKYFASVGYLDEGDILDLPDNGRGYNTNFGFKRINFRSNFDMKLTKTTKLAVNLSGYFSQKMKPNSELHQIWYGVFRHTPDSPLPVYSDGLYGDADPYGDRLGTNSFFHAQTKGNEKTNKTTINSDFVLSQDLDVITKGLKVSGRFSYDNIFQTEGKEVIDTGDPEAVYTRKYYDIYTDQWVYNTLTPDRNGFYPVPPPLGYRTETPNAGRTVRNYYYEVRLNYDRSFGDHNIGVLALFNRNERTTGSAYARLSEDWVGRITYNFKGRYLMEVNGSYNGTDQFGPGYKLEFFPSLSLGWRLSDEAFVKENLPWLSNFKVRGSWGKVGNNKLSNVGNWAYLSTWETLTGNIDQQFFGYPYPIRSTYEQNYSVYAEGVPGNPYLQWELAEKKNIGVDFSVLNSLFSGEIDVFKDHRTKMLLGNNAYTTMDYMGAAGSPVNLGETKSWGYEMVIRFAKKFGDFKVSSNINWAFADNEVIFKVDPQLTPDYQKQAGYRINQPKVSMVDGIRKSYDELYTGVVFENNSTNTQVLPGDYRMVDFNGDGKINGDDNAPWGYPRNPLNTYGFGLGLDYKNWSFSCQFNGAYNVNLDYSNFFDSFPISSSVAYNSTLDRTYSPFYAGEDGDIADLAITRNVPSGNTSRMDGSFLRLGSTQLSYKLPKQLAQKLSTESIRFYVSGSNLLFWSDLQVDMAGRDFAEKNYPTTKQFSLGLNVNF